MSIMIITGSVITVLLLTCSTVFGGEICASISLEGVKQRAFACPRLSDQKKDIYCCGNLNSSLACCDTETKSVYFDVKLKQSTEPRNNKTALVIVSLYGVILVVLVIIDTVSHFGLKKAAKEKKAVE